MRKIIDYSKNMTFDSLYQGTDARILAMTSEEKDEWRKICLKLADIPRRYYTEVYHLHTLKKSFENGNREDIFWNLSDAISRYDAMKNGNKQYQYGEIYLTNGFSMAKSYAYGSFAFGEVGLNAYRMLEAARFFGFEFPSNTRGSNLSARLWTFAHDNPKPVVLTFHNVPCDDLLFDDGKELTGFETCLIDGTCISSLKLKDSNQFDINKAEVQKLITTQPQK